VYLSFCIFLLIRSATESKKHQEQKQAKARNLREKLLAEKADRLRMLTKKVCSKLTFSCLCYLVDAFFRQKLALPKLHEISSYGPV